MGRSQNVQEGVTGVHTYADFQAAIVRSKIDRLEAEAAAERLARAAAAQRAAGRGGLGIRRWLGHGLIAAGSAIARETVAGDPRPPVARGGARRAGATGHHPCDELRAA